MAEKNEQPQEETKYRETETASAASAVGAPAQEEVPAGPAVVAEDEQQHNEEEAKKDGTVEAKEQPQEAASPAADDQLRSEPVGGNLLDATEDELAKMAEEAKRAEEELAHVRAERLNLLRAALMAKGPAGTSS
jgi:hypothetical protein